MLMSLRVLELCPIYTNLHQTNGYSCFLFRILKPSSMGRLVVESNLFEKTFYLVLFVGDFLRHTCAGFLRVRYTMVD